MNPTTRLQNRDHRGEYLRSTDGRFRRQPFVAFRCRPGGWSYGLRTPSSARCSRFGRQRRKPLVATSASYWDSDSATAAPTTAGPRPGSTAPRLVTPSSFLPTRTPTPPSTPCRSRRSSLHRSASRRLPERRFYGDYTLGFIRYAVMASEFTSSSPPRLRLRPHPVQLTVVPDVALPARHLRGALYRIAPSGGNRAPVVSGPPPHNWLAPLAVPSLSAAPSTPSTPPHYLDFVDGSTSTAANPPTYTRRHVHRRYGRDGRSPLDHVGIASATGRRRARSPRLRRLKYDADTPHLRRSGPTRGRPPGPAFS